MSVTQTFIITETQGCCFRKLLCQGL